MMQAATLFKVFKPALTNVKFNDLIVCGFFFFFLALAFLLCFDFPSLSKSIV